MTTSLSKPDDAALLRAPSALPDFMKSDDLRAVNDMFTGYVKPPSLKLIQGTTKPPLSERYSPGDGVLLPSAIRLAAKGETFFAVPLYFFPEWFIKNPLNAPKMIEDRTLDPASQIAVRSRNKDTRREPWPEDPSKFRTYVEALVFICTVVNHPEFSGAQFSVAFSGAEHQTGTGWSTTIKLRGIPLFGQVFEMKAGQRSNEKGTWWGWNPQAVAGPAGVVQDEPTFRLFNDQYSKLRQAHVDRLLVGVDEEVVEAPTSTDF